MVSSVPALTSQMTSQAPFTNCSVLADPHCDITTSTPARTIVTAAPSFAYIGQKQEGHTLWTKRRNEHRKPSQGRVGRKKRTHLQSAGHVVRVTRARDVHSVGFGSPSLAVVVVVVVVAVAFPFDRQRPVISIDPYAPYQFGIHVRLGIRGVYPRHVRDENHSRYPAAFANRRRPPLVPHRRQSLRYGVAPEDAGPQSVVQEAGVAVNDRYEARRRARGGLPRRRNDDGIRWRACRERAVRCRS